MIYSNNIPSIKQCKLEHCMIKWSNVEVNFEKIFRRISGDSSPTPNINNRSIIWKQYEYSLADWSTARTVASSTSRQVTAAPPRISDDDNRYRHKDRGMIEERISIQESNCRDDGMILNGMVDGVLVAWGAVDRAGKGGGGEVTWMIIIKIPH